MYALAAMRRGRPIALFVLALVAAVSCTLTTDLGGLSNGPAANPHDAGAEAVRDATAESSCPTGYASCNGAATCATNIADFDPNNCGACGAVCHDRCISGVCHVCVVLSEDTRFKLTCPPGRLVRDVAFAGWGTPTGTCGAFVNGTCNSTMFASYVVAACVGQSTCEFDADITTLGDPCIGTIKQVAVEAICLP